MSVGCAHKQIININGLPTPDNIVSENTIENINKISEHVTNNFSNNTSFYVNKNTKYGVKNEYKIQR